MRAASDAEFGCNPSLVFVQRKLGCQGKCHNRSCGNRIGMESSHSSSIGAMPGVLEALAKLLREEFYPKAIRAGLKALLTICIPRRNRIRVAEVGVVPLLIELLPDAKRSNVELALGVLELLYTTAKGRAAVANHALAMAALVHHLHTVSNLATELSVAILWSVCKASPTCLVLLLLQVRWIRAMYSDFKVFR